jgi:hypothetical protein
MRLIRALRSNFHGRFASSPPSAGRPSPGQTRFCPAPQPGRIAPSRGCRPCRTRTPTRPSPCAASPCRQASRSIALPCQAAPQHPCPPSPPPSKPRTSARGFGIRPQWSRCPCDRTMPRSDASSVRRGVRGTRLRMNAGFVLPAPPHLDGALRRRSPPCGWRGRFSARFHTQVEQRIVFRLSRPAGES